jgi:hypothetical protein
VVDERITTTMKLTAVFIAVALAIATYFTMEVLLNRIVERGIETVGPHLTGTSIELGEVDLTLHSGTGSVRGVVVGNPKGFQTDHAFELDEVRVDLAPLSLFGSTIVVEEIYIAGPKITYEKKGETSNLLTIAKHIHSVARGSKPNEAPSKEEGSKPSEGPKVRIDRFELKDAKVKAQILKDKTLDVRLPGIEMTHVGGPQGASVGRVSAEVMDTVTGRVVAAVTKRALSLGAGGASDRGSEQVEEDQPRKKRRSRRQRVDQ